jgi:hypothetical protein
MTNFKRIVSLKPQTNDNNNRITCVWVGPDSIQREYSINQRTLNRYANETELKAALDKFTQQNFGYVLTDIWFHKNRNGRWAVATGPTPPVLWPEDEPVV